jgi:hypothetical protein
LSRAPALVKRRRHYQNYRQENCLSGKVNNNVQDKEKQTTDFARYKIISCYTKAQSEPYLYPIRDWGYYGVYYYRDVFCVLIHVRDSDRDDAPDCRVIIFLLFSDFFRDCVIYLRFLIIIDYYPFRFPSRVHRWMNVCSPLIVQTPIDRMQRSGSVSGGYMSERKVAKTESKKTLVGIR